MRVVLWWPTAYRCGYFYLVFIYSRTVSGRFGLYIYNYNRMILYERCVSMSILVCDVCARARSCALWLGLWG